MEQRSPDVRQDEEAERFAGSEAAKTRARIILNKASGAAVGTEAQAVLDQVAGQLRDGGWRADGAVVEPAGIQRAIEDALNERDFDVLVVAGGDGTIQSAARALVGTEIPLGIIPLGTFNQIARELGIPTDPVAAAQCLARARAEKIDVGWVNGRLFLGTVLVGLPPKFTSGRQELRGTTARERLVGYSRLMRRMVGATRKISFMIDDGSERRRVRALSVAVSNNPFEESEQFFKRASLTSGRLGLYISRHQTGARMFSAYLLAFLGLWRRDPKFERLSAKRVCLETRQRRLLVSIDGEIESLKTPLRFKIEPQALCVLQPCDSP